MRVIADLHLHSKYSRATSPQMDVVNLAIWGKKKGINLLATGDITHPVYLKELKEQLVEDGSGFLELKNRRTKEHKDIETKEQKNIRTYGDVKFILSGEVSCIYKHNDKTRRQHHCVYFPDFKSVDRFNKILVDKGCNLRSDGRPIIGLSSRDLLEVVLCANKEAMLIPAHIWTPWFALFGSKSGYDSKEECFGDLSEHVFAMETGLSSDPAMNWRLSQLDNVTLISSSDAHSLKMIGREANVFEFDEFTYDELRNTLKNKDLNKFKYTIEFYPQEGKYYYDGHRECGVVMSPEESLKYNNICPKCKKEMVLGVDHRIQDLADRKVGYQLKKTVPFKSVIPLYEILAEIRGVGKNSKRVWADYEEIIEKGGSEFNVLLELSQKEIEKISNPVLAEAIIRMREGKVNAQPGYDGEFGIIKVFSQAELDKLK